MPVFYRLLAISLVAATSTNFVWFALTYWAYLTTGSVIATSTMAGIFLVVNAVSGIWFGSLVDHLKKKHALLISSGATFVLFMLALALFRATPVASFADIASVPLWAFIVILLCGTVAGSIYAIAVPTLIGLTVPEDRRDRANGMFGTTIGIAFGITSVASGVSLAYGGMDFVLSAALIGLALVLVALAILPLPEPTPAPHPGAPSENAGKVDLAGTIAVVRAMPGLFPLIFFTTFNNFLGGVFFSLMDAYGLTLMSVEYWGFLWGILSLAMIAGGLYVSRRGLGDAPLRMLFRVNLITWATCVFFVIRPSVPLLAAGIFVWMFLFPFIEASEQTIMQKVVPPERLGRVFGFAHGIEQSASPFTAFFIGPLTQFIFIPFMTTGGGARAIGPWFGTGPGRGIALVFIVAGVFGMTVTLLAMRSRAYALLADRLGQKV